MQISKLEAARRQLDAAIDLYFNEGDSLAIHTLAFASLKVLFDLYPHRNSDGFAAQVDQLMGDVGWKSMAGVANFLKHADRDPDAVLEHHHPEMGYAIIGLAVLLYRRIAGDFTVKMMALDLWTETLGAEELGIPEQDQNPRRAAMNRQIRESLNQAPREKRMAFAKKHYDFFLANYERLQREADEATAQGKSLQQLLDEKLGEPPEGD